MGAEQFTSHESGTDVIAVAFDRACESAAYEYGHGGYTGTIAEKDNWVIVADAPLPYSDAEELAQKLMDDDDERIADKWGPAGAIQTTGPDGWLFFGWASR